MSIRKRILPRTGETRWLIDYRDQAGARRAKQFRTKGEAVAWETTMRGQVRDGVHVADAASITIADAGKAWIQSCEAKGLEQITIGGHRRNLRLHVNPMIGHVKLSRFTAPAAQTFIDDLIKDHSPAAVRAISVILKMALSHAVRRGYAAFNAAAEIELPSTRRHEKAVACPTLAEIKLLLEKADGDFLRPVVHCAIFTGMRASELRGLHWADVDLKDGLIRIQVRADRLNKIGDPKSRAGRREIPIGQHLVAVMREWKLKQPVEQRRLDLVFPNETGGIVNHTNLWRYFGRLQVACGITEPQFDADGQPMRDRAGRPLVQPKYGFHALRHACASLLISQGWQPKRIQAFMGHASIAMTFDVYGHLLKDADSDAKAIAKLEFGLLGSQNVQ